MSRKPAQRKHKQTTKTHSSYIAVTEPTFSYKDICEWCESLVPASELDRIVREVKQIEAMTPVYAALPPSLASLAFDATFVAARSYGRLSFRDDLYTYDETTSSRLYNPTPLTRDEVCEVVASLVGCPTDDYLSHTLPLSWRAGFTHGWLSALLISQPREAGIGLVAFTHYLTPVLLGRSVVAATMLTRPTTC